MGRMKEAYLMCLEIGWDEREEEMGRRGRRQAF
jgi:hypothetical protein